MLIVLLVIGVGSTQITPSNWLPFAPHGFKAVVTSASVVFFSYVGFDAVANTAEESRNPQVATSPLLPPLPPLPPLLLTVLGWMCGCAA